MYHNGTEWSDDYINPNPAFNINFETGDYSITDSIEFYNEDNLSKRQDVSVCMYVAHGADSLAISGVSAAAGWYSAIKSTSGSI